MKKKEIKEEVIAVKVAETPAVSEKDELLALYDKLNAMGIRSISDLENKIANCR